MPSLRDLEVRELVDLARAHGVCGDCHQQTGMDYCRTCDEFYWLHRAGCRMYEPKHFGHRLTIVPFVEVHHGR